MTNSESAAAVHGELLLELSFLVNERKSVDEVFASFALRLLDAADFDYTTLLIGEPGSGYMEVVASYPFELPGAPRGATVSNRAYKYDDLLAAREGYEYAIRRESETAATRELAMAGMARAWVQALTNDGKVYGSFTIARKSREPVTDTERQFLLGATRLLTAAVRQEMELRQARRAAARAQAANELALALNAGETIEQSFQRLTDLVARSLDADYFGLFLDRDGGFMLVDESPRGVHQGDPPTDEGTRFILERLAATNFTQARPERDASPSNAMVDAGYKRLGVAVLREDEKPAGLLLFGRVHSWKFNEEDQAFIELLRSMLSQTITNQRRLARSEAEAARAHALNQAALLLKEDEPADKVFARVVPLLEGAIGFDYVALLEADMAMDELTMVAAQPALSRVAGDRLELSHQLVNDLTNADSPAIQYRIENVDESPGVPELREAGMRRGVTALLRHGDEVVGLFVLARRGEARLDADEMSFIGTLANLLGQALANRRRMETVVRQAARSRLLNEIAVQLDAGESLEDLFERLPALLPEALEYDHLSLLTITGDGQALRVVGTTPERGFAVGGTLPLPTDRETVRQLNQRSLLQFDPSRAVGPGAEALARAGYRHTALAVMRDADEVLGAFVVSRREPRPFDSEQCAFIEMLATLLTTAVVNQAHLQKARKDAARTQLLSELSVLLHNGEGPEAMFTMLSRRLPEQIAFDALALLVHEGEDRLRVVDSLRRRSMRPGSYFAVEDLGNAVARLSGKDLVWETAIEDVVGRIGRATEEAGIRRALIVALRHNQETSGYLFVARTSAQPFREEERAYVEILATIMAQAIANHRKLADSKAETIRSQVLSELSMLLQEGDSIADRFDRISELLLQAVGFDHISVTVREPGSERYQVVRSHRLTLDGEPIDFDPGGIDVVREGNRTTLQYRTSDAVRRVPRALSQAGFQRAATAAIVSNEGVEGLLTIGRKLDTPFDDKEMAFIELVSAFLGQAASNHRKAWAKAQEQEEQAIIAEAAAAVAREITGLGIVFAMRTSVARFIPEAFCNFGYLEGDSIVFSAPDRPRIVLPIGPGFRNALDNGYDLVPKFDRAVGSPEARVETERTGLQSHVITAAQSGGETVGLLIMGSRDSDFEPGEREVRLARLLADIVGPAMANVRAIERQRLEGEDQRLLAEVAAVAAREAEPSALLAALHRPLRAMVPSPMVIFGFREGDRTIYPRLDGTYVEFPLDSYLRMLDDVGQIHSEELPEDLFAESELWQMGIHAISSTAVLAGGKTVGYLMVGSRAKGYTFSDRELRIFRLLAQIVGPAMENARAAARAKADAEEQAILAEAAAALAAGATEGEVIATLTPSIQRFLPTALTAVYFVDGDELAGPLGRGPFGPIASAAMATGQVAVEKPWPPMSADGLETVEAAGIERFTNTSLNAGGASTDILFVGLKEPDIRFSDRDLRLIRLIADMAGPAIANARESTRRRLDAEEQRFLAETAAAAAGATSEADLVRGLAKPFDELLPGSKIDLFYAHPEGMLSAITGMILPIGRNFRAALELGQSMAPANSPGTTSAAAQREREMGTTHGVSTRLSSGGQTLGLFWLGTTSTEPPTERDLRICRLVADVVGPALANLRESRRRKEDAEEQRFLAAAAAAAASAATQDQLVREIAKPFAELIPGSRVDVLYQDSDGLRSTVTGLVFPAGPHIEAALRHGQDIGEPSLQGITSQAAAAMTRLSAVQALSTRLSSGGQTLGILWIGTTDPQRPFTDRDQRICRLVADVVAPALANLRESSRRKEDAEEQRFLAAAASAAASAPTQEQLVRDLSKTFVELIPGSRVDLFYQEGDGLRSTITGGFFPIGPHFEAALRDGQRVGEPFAEAGTREASAGLSRLNVVQAASTRLSSGGQTQGLLWIGTTDPERLLNERDLRICRLVADVVGPALANLRESSRRKEDAEEQRFLAAVAAAAATATSEDELIRGLREPFRTLTPNSVVSFFFRDGDQLRAGDQLFGIGPQIEEAFRTGQSAGQIDDPEVLLSSVVFMRANRIARWINTTASSEGVTLGILHVALRELEQQFSERELRMYRLAADIVGPAMAHLRENARRAREADDERVLASVAAMAAVTASPDELMERFIELLRAFVSAPVAVYGHVEGDTIRYRISNPESQELLGVSELVVPMIGASRDARAKGQGSGTLADRVDQPYSPLGLQAYCVTSYHSVGSELGMLLVASTDPEYRFSEADLALLRRIAQVLGPAIEAARAEEQRARQAELYSLMLRSLSEGVILADNDGRPVFANELGRKVLRALNPDGTAINWETIVDLLPEEARAPYRQVFQDGSGGRGRSSLVIEGQLTHLDYEFVPLNDPQMRLLVVVTDVTQDVLHAEEQQRSRDRMEQAARLAALGELIGGVAHELNNPLTAVVGFAELMSANPAAEPLAEEISVIQKEARRAADIVRDLLFIARPGTSERAKISVADLVGHIERIRRAHWIGAGIQPSIAIEPGCQVWGNEHQLTQVILNLVTNAEHALAGQPERRLSLSATCVSGRTTIAISDTGKGMDEATLARIWEPFFTTKPGVGTGLGLPLSYSIIQSHNGQVVVESRPGKGTTFRIELPSGPELSAVSGDEPVRDLSTARVLVVDDEPSLRKVCQRLVASLGHECETAENSAAALALAEARDFDLVLCDYRLATETADHVIAGFEAVAPHLIPRTVIATGATTDAGVVDLTERYGLELIAKPYGAEELSRIIAEALARSAESEAA